MKSLGIELKGNTCIGVLVSDGGSVLETLKVELKDSYESESVKEFHDSIKAFLETHTPGSIIIKKRNEKGKFAGGAASFKMEGLIQIAAQANILFLSGAQLNAFTKKVNDYPEVKKYQSQALFCAMYGLNI